MDYLEELNKIKEWIKNLIIIQYRQSQKNRALIDFLVELVFSNNLVLKIRDLCLNVEKSKGAQLDVVGKWVGVDRFYNGVELWEHPYLSFINYSNYDKTGDPPHPLINIDPMQGGFSSYLTFEDNNGGFLTYQSWKNTRTATNTIGDEYFRMLIKLKIIKNSINHTMRNIDKAIYNWSSGKVYTTWMFSLYSSNIVDTNDNLYQATTAKDFIQNNENMKIYGVVKTITEDNIIIVDINNTELYNGSYEYTTVTETINDESSTIYKYSFGNPMEIVYHYDASYKNLITMAAYKNALPAPTGCEIVTQQIV